MCGWAARQPAWLLLASGDIDSPEGVSISSPIMYLILGNHLFPEDVVMATNLDSFK